MLNRFLWSFSFFAFIFAHRRPFQRTNVESINIRQLLPNPPMKIVIVYSPLRFYIILGNFPLIRFKFWLLHCCICRHKLPVTREATIEVSVFSQVHGLVGRITWIGKIRQPRDGNWRFEEINARSIRRFISFTTHCNKNSMVGVGWKYSRILIIIVNWRSNVIQLN